ncbi:MULTISPECIES: hypothetical protein [Clostridium]|uniref:Uncharacterized protein n=1 Tax=Clostridium saccharoperbutylacetonicum N1-4(HMT) TaxID=931276 RepID=M1MWT5_9CLOT|nr:MULTISPECIES: hypothetical protein [Clostridium]AGF59041.1 hypothetical protein Cspa_c52960 [Clostridium saccharoperbutylacetonicum N1-4(HMT)]AQR97710.1 hypothetical protein CLSAP_50430 [Clostridium saccharoperbutylacetonicum]NRT60171.1 hypothetical protein [Clostridium saccharoperbutylacetonicum]NSB23483.1 hypothetical protein [Clostridium saccharoperbutylacetonicum]NSB33598.1 hypothetical protein [Clostridium saccharoperbutylacetonicum]
MENNIVKSKKVNEEDLKKEVNKYAKCSGKSTISDCMKCHETEQGCHEYWAIWCKDND